MLDDIQLHLVESLDDVEQMMQWLGERREWLAVDVETTGLNVGCDWIRLCQFGDGAHGWALDWRDWRGVCAEVVRKYDRPMVTHNLLFDSKMLKADGVVIPQRLAHCSMIMSHLADPAGYFDLKGSASRWVDKRARAGQGLLKAAMAQGGWTWATIPVHVPAYWQYSAMDTCLSALLAERLWSETGGGPYREAYELELATIHCLREAELAGLLVDEEYRRAATEKLEVEIAWLQPQIPCENPGSDQQVVALLQAQGAVLFVRTEHGNLSVDKSVLAYLEPQFPVAGLIRAWRQKRRFVDNYLLKFAEVGSKRGLAVEGVLRASTQPVGAKTGRMSVKDPPLQTLPRGRVVRDAIVARPGHVFVGADFAGMEMRALASFAHEENMLAAYARGEDLHNFVARTLYGEAFTKLERTVCKNAGFAKVYGAGVEKFAVTAKIDVPTATAFLERYDAMFPGVKEFMEANVREVMARAGGQRNGTGYVVLTDGRRLPVPGEKAYVSTNYKIQGSCAVTTKQKIVELDAAGLGPYFRLAVHDELLYEVPHPLVRRAREVIERVMPDRINFPGVVLEVDTDVFDRWGYHYREDYPSFIPTEPAPWLTGVAT